MRLSSLNCEEASGLLMYADMLNMTCSASGDWLTVTESKA